VLDYIPPMQTYQGKQLLHSALDWGKRCFNFLPPYWKEKSARRQLDRWLTEPRAGTDAVKGKISACAGNWTPTVMQKQPVTVPGPQTLTSSPQACSALCTGHSTQGISVFGLVKDEYWLNVIYIIFTRKKKSREVYTKLKIFKLTIKLEIKTIFKNETKYQSCCSHIKVCRSTPDTASTHAGDPATVPTCNCPSQILVTAGFPHVFLPAMFSSRH
jgi:hypothetical protein